MQARSLGSACGAAGVHGGGGACDPHDPRGRQIRGGHCPAEWPRPGGRGGAPDQSRRAVRPAVTPLQALRGRPGVQPRHPYLDSSPPWTLNSPPWTLNSPPWTLISPPSLPVLNPTSRHCGPYHPYNPLSKPSVWI
eukprot:1095705-Prorocentrum_minimum.AAC.1